MRVVFFDAVSWLVAMNGGVSSFRNCDVSAISNELVATISCGGVPELLVGTV